MAGQGLRIPSLAAKSIVRSRLLPTPARRRLTTRKWESTAVTREGGSGQTVTAPTSSIFFIGSLLPLGLGRIALRRFSRDGRPEERYMNSLLGILNPVGRLKRAVLDKIPSKEIQIIPRLKDGGVFVMFTSNMPGADIEEQLTKLLETEGITTWLNPFRRASAGLVQGRPWLEDLDQRPKRRLKIESASANGTELPAGLSPEQLYSLLRRYGRIAHITPLNSNSTVSPNSAYVKFYSVRHAIMAKNCLHGSIFHEQGSKHPVRLQLSYHQSIKAHVFWDSLISDPRFIISRIGIPLVAGFLGWIYKFWL